MSATRGNAAEHFVAEAARVLSLSLDYEATIGSLAQLAVPTFADWCFVDLVSEDGDAFDRVAIGHHLPGSDETAKWLKRRYPAKMDTPVGVARAILEGEPQLLTDLGDDFAQAIARDADHLRSLRALHIRSAVIAPLLVRGKPIGALSLMATDRNLSDDDLWFVTQLGHSAAAAIDNARLFESERRARIRVTKLLESERRSNTRLRSLAQVGETLAQPLELDETLRAIAQLMVPALADWCVIDLLEGRAIRRVATVHQDPAKVLHARRISGRYQPALGDNSAIARVIAGGKAHFYPALDPEQLERAARDDDELKLLRGEGLVSTIIVPLTTSGECIGALSLTTSDSGRVYDETDADFAAELGRRVGIAIESSRMRRELEAAHDRMLRLFMQAPMSIAIYKGQEHVLEFANPTFLQVRARGRDVIGKTYVEVFPESYATTKAVLQRAFTSGEPQTFPEVGTMLDRGQGPEEAFFHLSFVALKDEQGQVDRLMSVSFEVTDRVLARRALDAERGKLQMVFKQAPFPIGVFEGPEHRIVFANAKWEGLVGRSLPAGQRLVDAVPELKAQGILAMHDRALAGETVVGQEIPLQFATGGVMRLHHFHVVLHPLFDDAGNIEGHITMALDVTDQVRTRTEIDAARRDAEAANRAKDDFLAMLGHELRNPLAPIMTALNLMGLRGVVGAERERSVITRQVQHLTRMVDDLLDVSRIIRGKVELSRETVELSELVSRGLETASPLFEERNQYVEVKVPRHGLRLMADPARMAQALSNLFTNAAKYTNSGGHISVVAEPADAEVVLKVTDDG
ncbi:MAG TPA: PAS domain-containing protein, partial [Polyangiaceae bacterium]